MKFLGGRRWKRRCRRRCGASVVPWLGGEVEDVVTELSSTLDGRGRAGGHGYGDEDGELRSVVCAGGKQRRERGPGEEREGWTAPGGCVASPRMDRLEGEASSTKQEVAGVGARASSTQLLRGEGEEDDWQLGCTVTGPIPLKYFMSFWKSPSSQIKLFRGVFGIV